MPARPAARDVVDVDAVEHLARLDDAMRRAVAQPVDGAAAGPVDAGEAEDLRRACRASAAEARSHSCSACDAAPAARRSVACVGIVSSIQAPPLSP